MRKRLLASGLIIAPAIAFCVYGFMTYKGKVTPVNPIPSALAKAVKMSASKLLDAPEVTDKERPPEKAWGRDPFTLPLGVEVRAAEEGEITEAAKPRIKKVTAILITDSRKVASINHRVVAVGDLIDGERVLEIRPDRVVLERGDQRTVITLEETPIRWKKNEEEKHEK